MQNLFWLAKISGKQVFKNLKSQSPFYSDVLKTNIEITKVFYDHIVYNKKKKRSQKEIIKRILVIPFIQEILNNGNLTKERTKKEKKYFRISLLQKKGVFSVIILKNKQNYSLLSCFLD
jgi:hypothetical protein